jgi:hypothetical protein
MKCLTGAKKFFLPTCGNLRRAQTINEMLREFSGSTKEITNKMRLGNSCLATSNHLFTKDSAVATTTTTSPSEDE